MSSSPGKESNEFKKEKHIKYFQRCLNVLPSAYKSMDTSRYGYYV